MTGFDSHVRRVASLEKLELAQHISELSEAKNDQSPALELRKSDDELTKITLKVHSLLDESAQIIAVTGLGENNGGSYLSLRIAQAFAGFHPDKKILLVDVDFNSPNLHHEFNVSKSPGLQEVLQSHSRIDEALSFSGSPGLYVLPAGENKAQISHQTLLYNLTTLIPKLKPNFSIILLSAPDMSSSLEAELSVTQSDAVVVVIKSGEVGKQQIKEIDSQITQAGSKFFGIVLSQ